MSHHPPLRSSSRLPATGTALRTHHPDRATAVGPGGSAQPPISGVTHAAPLVPGGHARGCQRCRHCASARPAARPLGPPRSYEMPRILFWTVRCCGRKTWLVGPAASVKQDAGSHPRREQGSRSWVPPTAAPVLLLTFAPNWPAGPQPIPLPPGAPASSRRERGTLYGETTLGPTILNAAVKRVLTFLL